MSRDQDRAREIVDSWWANTTPGNLSLTLLQRGIAQALARERREENEACALKVDNWLLAYGGLDRLAAAIRARQTSGQDSA